MYAPDKDVKYTVKDEYYCLEFLRKDSIELSLAYCGKDVCEPGHTYGPAARDEYLLHYIIDGKGQFTVGERTWNLKKHDAFLIFPDEITVYSADKELPWSYIWIAFSGFKADEYLQHAGFSESNRIGHFLCEEKLTTLVEKILSEHELTYSNQLDRHIHLLEFLSCLIHEYEDTTNTQTTVTFSTKQSYIIYAMNYLEQNYQNNITISNLCNRLGIARSYLTKLFKEELHTSPYDYLINIRIDKASSLLRLTSLPIKQISTMVGYQDSLVFSRIFKQKTGLSPKAYRNSSNNLILSNTRNE
ncbi:MAG: AraC family transcriptional regulator [Ruminococcus sp.]|nr:AraC family transcriptional regulator [Ruminococcus sp.]